MFKWFKFNWPCRRYQLYLINTTVECRLYLWDNWEKILPYINTLVALTDQPAFIRTYQSYEFENRWLGFGRMKWSDENNRKWTTKYRDNNFPGKVPEFYYTEIWAPDWNALCKTGMPPDIFVHLYNNPGVQDVTEGIIIALPISLYDKNKLLIDDAVSKIAVTVTGSKIYEAKRDWWGRRAVRNSIEAINIHEVLEIMKSGK
ncbi:hypothetical protein [Mucilaginibacter sp. HD30]